jgi:negative regulator of replication initiation
MNVFGKSVVTLTYAKPVTNSKIKNINPGTIMKRDQDQTKAKKPPAKKYIIIQNTKGKRKNENLEIISTTRLTPYSLAATRSCVPM